jgi:hypothetical protein
MLHKDRIRILLIAITVFVLAAWSGTAGATESRPEWEIQKGSEKHVLKSGESELLSEAVSNKGIVFKQTTGTGLTTSCTKAQFTGESRITGPRANSFSAFFFEGCSVTAPAGDTTCEVASTGFPNGQIRTQSLGFFAEEALEGTTAKPYLKLRPESTHAEIVTIQLKGGTCANAGSYEIDGQLVGLMAIPSLSTVHQFNFGKNTGTRLTIGGVESEFSGALLFTLKSGNEWGPA